MALAIAKIVQGGAAGQASEATAGILKLSTNPQALAGTDDSTAITPLKLAQKLANFLGQATEVAFGWLKIATQALVNAGEDDATAVTPKKLAAAIRSQALTAFTTAGSAGALTLTPVPAIQAYATPLRFRVKFSQNSTGTDTINVSGQGAKSLKQYDSTGAKVAAVFAANQLADVEYDGTDIVLLDQLPATVAQRPQGLRGATVNWKANANGTSSNITCTGDSVTLASAAGDPSVATNIATILNTAVAASATVDGMASGAVAANTWYGVYVWKNTATTGVRVTGDSAFTTGLPPVAPAAGFDAWAFVGVFLTDSTGKPLRYFQNQRSYELSKLAGTNVATLPIAASGNTAGVVTAVSLTGKIPPGASKVKLSTYTPGDASAQCFAMPSTAYAISEYAGGSGPSISNYFLSVVPVEILLQGSTSFAWVSAGPNSKITLLGWEI